MSHLDILSKRGSIGIITLKNTPVNALSQSLRMSLDAAITQFWEDESLKVAILRGDGALFSAGADVNEFGHPLKAPFLPDVINRIADCPKPIIALVNGIALGGGLEVALGCHYRLMHNAAVVSFPEVKLGLIPGAGGTQRTPRLIGIDLAIDLLSSGRKLNAVQAEKIGLVDKVISKADPMGDALQFAEMILSTDSVPIREAHQDFANGAIRQNYPFEEKRLQIERNARGLVAPLRIVDAVEAGVNQILPRGMLAERGIFNELLETKQHAALKHVFKAERAASRIPELPLGTARKIRSVGIVGGGTMGAGIALAMMNAEISVTLVERDAPSLAAGQKRIEQSLKLGIQKGKLTSDHRDWLLANFFIGSTDMHSLSDVDIAIEAVYEDMEVKRQIFEQFDAICKPGAILATNTSYLDINEIAALTCRPQDVVGLHFFSPANLMQLLEVIVGKNTHADVTLTGFALAKRMGKVAVRAEVCDGFIGNRLLAKYSLAAQYLVEDGASPYEVDAAMVAFGYPMGPFAVMDLAGLDIGWAARKRRHSFRRADERYAANWIDELCQKGWYGRKSGRGIYKYSANGRVGEESADVIQIIENVRQRKERVARRFEPQEIVERYMLAMINEGAKILEEGIAQRPSDIDVTQIFGYGHPRWRGGPMHYADSIGLHNVLEGLKKYGEENPHFWKASSLLEKLVRKNINFSDLN